MAARFLVGGSFIAGAAAIYDLEDPGDLENPVFENMKTQKEYLSLTSNFSYYTTVNSKVQIPAADLLDVDIPMPLKLAKRCPNLPMPTMWCVAPGALAEQFPNYDQHVFGTHGVLAGDHTTTSVEFGPEGHDTIACHYFTDGYFCHDAEDKMMSTYTVLADDGAVGYGVMCHGDKRCHVLADKDVLLTRKSRDHPHHHDHDDDHHDTDHHGHHHDGDHHGDDHTHHHDGDHHDADHHDAGHHDHHHDDDHHHDGDHHDDDHHHDDHDHPHFDNQDVVV